MNCTTTAIADLDLHCYHVNMKCIELEMNVSFKFCIKFQYIHYVKTSYLMLFLKCNCLWYTELT